MSILSLYLILRMIMTKDYVSESTRNAIRQNCIPCWISAPTSPCRRPGL